MEVLPAIVISAESAMAIFSSRVEVGYIIYRQFLNIRVPCRLQCLRVSLLRHVEEHVSRR